MAKRTKLSDKEALFVKEYPLDFNGTEAYMRATGETNRNAAAQAAHRFLKLDLVNDAVNTYVQEQLGPHEKTLLGNVKFWISVRDDTFTHKFIYLDDLQAIFEEYPQIDEDWPSFEAVVKEKALSHPSNKTADRMKASEMLGKYAQMFVERKDVNVSATVKIVDDL